MGDGLGIKPVWHTPSGRAILPMPLGGVGPDDIAIANCAMCGDMVSSIPLCWSCWSFPDDEHQKKVDALMLAMPADWPGRRLYEPRIEQARSMS